MNKAKSKHQKIDPKVIQDEIYKRAYEISLEKGKEGDDISNWLQAEKEIFEKYNIPKKEKEITKMEDRKKYIDKLSAQLKEWDDEIKEYQNKTKTLKTDSKEMYQKMLSDLNSQKKAAQKKLEDLKNSSEDSWEVLKEGSEKIWKETKKTFEKAVLKFK